MAFRKVEVVVQQERRQTVLRKKLVRGMVRECRERGRKGRGGIERVLRWAEMSEKR